ncbi:MAG TPA: hypothetical protein VGL62_07665 [Vicinamibacterales bacterium]|jgi:hypothetical protein
MANPGNAYCFGFRPIVRQGGSPFSLTEYGKAAADTHAIYAFDLVGKITGGTPFPMPENPAYNLPSVQDGSQLTPGTSLWLGASLAYGAASTGTVHPVADEIDCVFLARAYGTTGVTSATGAGLNANVKLVAGSSTTKMSLSGLDDSGIATTSSLDLRILKIATIVPNIEGVNAMVEVTINKHQFGQATTAT